MGHLIDPLVARDAMAAGLGTFVYLVATRRPGWLQVLSLFIVGQATAFYCVMLVAEELGWDMSYYPTISFGIGALGMLVWGAVINLAQGFHDDPKAMLRFAIGLWRGSGSGDDKKDAGK